MKHIILCFLLFSSPIVSVEHFHLPVEALTIAARYLPQDPLILEAGAYDGNETVAMAKFFPQASIHAFEPIPYLYNKLQKNAQQCPTQIHTYDYALSDKHEITTMYVSEEPDAPNIPSMSSSLLPPKEHLNYSTAQFKKEILVPAITIDAWAQQYAIEKVDFLWLDMQGYELPALKASSHILKTVKVILTEVEFVEAYAGQYLFNDVKIWLEQQGFTMVANNFGTYSWFGDALFVRI